MASVSAVNGSNTQNNFDVQKVRKSNHAEAVQREEGVENAQQQQEEDLGTNVDAEI